MITLKCNLFQVTFVYNVNCSIIISKKITILAAQGIKRRIPTQIDYLTAELALGL